MGTSPFPLSRATVATFVADQDKVADAPGMMVSGAAEIVTVGQTDGSITTTVTLSVTVTPSLVPVIVYVVVCWGEIVSEPLAETVPIPGSTTGPVWNFCKQVIIL